MSGRGKEPTYKLLSDQSTVYRDSHDITDTIGKNHGPCPACGAATVRMGWLGNKYEFWVMCIPCGQNAMITTPNRLGGHCKCPTLEQASQRLGIVGLKADSVAPLLAEAEKGLNDAAEAIRQAILLLTPPRKE